MLDKTIDKIYILQGLMDLTGQYGIIYLAPPKGQVAGSNPARDTNRIKVIVNFASLKFILQSADRVQNKCILISRKNCT